MTQDQAAGDHRKCLPWAWYKRRSEDHHFHPPLVEKQLAAIYKMETSHFEKLSFVGQQGMPGNAYSHILN